VWRPLFHTVCVAAETDICQLDTAATCSSGTAATPLQVQLQPQRQQQPPTEAVPLSFWPAMAVSVAS